MDRFVQWDSLELRVSGEKLNGLVKSMIAGKPPIEKIELDFRNGLMRVTGTVRKFIAVPFRVDVTEMRAAGTTVRVPLRGVSAAGIPLPTILVTLLKSQFPRDLIELEPPATMVMSLDRFLPPFVTADVQKIWIIEGGLAITLGRGGAVLPESPGGSHDHHDTDRLEPSR
jgi:hypothetical protein